MVENVSAFQWNFYLLTFDLVTMFIGLVKVPMFILGFSLNNVTASLVLKECRFCLLVTEIKATFCEKLRKYSRPNVIAMRKRWSFWKVIDMFVFSSFSIILKCKLFLHIIRALHFISFFIRSNPSAVTTTQATNGHSNLISCVTVPDSDPEEQTVLYHMQSHSSPIIYHHSNKLPVN